MKHLNILLAGLILLLSGYYYYINVDKLSYVWDQIQPIVEQKDKSDIDIVSVEVESDDFKVQKSFVKEVVVDVEGKGLYFLEVPDVKGTVTVDGNVVEALYYDEGIVVAEHENSRVFIIRDNYEGNVALLIQEEGKSQP